MGLERTRQLRGLLGAAAGDSDGFLHETAGNEGQAQEALRLALAVDGALEGFERVVAYKKESVLVAVSDGRYVLAALLRRDAPGLKDAGKALRTDFQEFVARQT